jgi:hypothetical protein
MWDLCNHPAVLDIVEDLLGPNIVCFRVHYFAKGASDVDEKTVTWHQDAYYWPLTPSKCVTVWVAIDDIDQVGVQITKRASFQRLFVADSLLMPSLPPRIISKRVAPLHPCLMFLLTPV